jgi:hypothetical protein
MRSLLAATAAAVISLAVLAPSALAHDGGQGLYGVTNDKVVTNAGFLLIIFFPVFIILMSLAQARLDKRKEARKAAHQAREASGEAPGGW